MRRILFLSVACVLLVAAGCTGCTGRQNPGRYRPLPEGVTNVWMP